MLQLMKNGAFVMEVQSGSTFTLDNGNIVSPAVANWEQGEYTLVPKPEPEPQTDAELLQAERMAMVVSRLQARTALRRMGLFTAVDSFVNQSGDVELIDAWNNASEFRRFSATILNLASHFDLDDEALDNLFRQARLIEF